MAEIIRRKPAPERAAKIVQTWCEEIVAKSADSLGPREAEEDAAFRAAADNDIQVEKEKIKTEFDLKKKKLAQGHAVAKSKKITEGRLARMAAQEQRIGDVAKDVRAAMEGAGDEEFYSSLMAQACLMLLESAVVVRCRKGDEAKVKAAIPAAQKKYAETVLKQAGKTKQVQLTIDSANPLGDDSLGGVIVNCGAGSISVDNTIAARLNLILDLDKPAIRQRLFTSSLA